MSTTSPTPRELFADLLANAPREEWDARLDEIRQNDPQLADRVEKLLEAHLDPQSFLDKPLSPTVSYSDDAAVGAQIGPYKLREQIGEGGFGVVYIAEQTKPIRRKVALKIIKPGMDSKEIIARFEAERQALALMDHPNIAKVLDAGTTGRVESPESSVERETTLNTQHSTLNSAATRPYFVMEFVRGLPVTEFCDREKLTTENRLRLFTDVCRAVQHAHQKGVIHRDIKPTNVLVTLHDGKPVPKVIDFGVAKALSQQLTENTLYTAMGQMVGTPMYMSPEQAEMSGLDVDTRSDVYSLGVLLYELLTGSTPFDKQTLREAGLEGMRRIIRETEPVKPSARISTLKDDHGATISDNRRVDRKRLEQALRGDLDWVVMKALEKDRNRRYETPSAFAADVDRYLNYEPVAASPPSALYRLQKYARRNRQGVITCAVLALICLVVVGAVGWVVRDRAAQRAVLRTQVMAALNDVEILLAEGRPRAALTAAERARDMVAQSEADAALIAAVQQGNADVRMVLRLEQIRLDENDRRLIAQYEAAFEEYGVPLNPTDPERIAAAIRSRPKSVRQALLSAVNNYWHLLYIQGMLGINVDDELRITEILRDSPGDDSPLRVGDRVHGMGTSLDDIVDTDSMSGDEFQRKLRVETGPIVVLRVTSAGDPEPRTVSLTRPAHWRQVLAVLRAADDDPWRRKFWDALEQHDYGAFLRLRRSEDLLLQPPATISMVVRHRFESTNHVEILRDAQTRYPGDFWINYDLAFALVQLDPPEWRKALPFAEVAVALRPDSARAHDSLGVLRARNRDEVGATVQFRRAIELDPYDAHAHFNLGDSLGRQNKLDEAIAEFRRAIELEPDHAFAHARLADILKATGDLPGAIDAYREAARLQPLEAWRHAKVAEALELSGDRDGAIVAWANAIKEGMFPDRDTESGLWTLMTDDEAFFAEVTRLLPDDPRPWEARGRAFARQEQWDRAAADYAEALRLIDDSDYPDWFGDEGPLALQIARLPEMFDRVRALRPTDDRLSVGRAREYAATGRFQMAADELEGVVARHPEAIWSWYVLAQLQLLVHNAEGYQSSCAELLARHRADAQKIMAARACLLARDVTPDRCDQIQDILDNTVPPVGWGGLLFEIPSALVAIRRGDPALARATLSEFPRPQHEREAIVTLLSALVAHQEGRFQEARDAYTNVVEYLETERAIGDATSQRMEIDQWLTAEILRREVAELLQIMAEEDEFFGDITRLLPEDPRVWESHGRAFALEGEWDRAASDYWQALQLVDDTDPNAWFGADVELALRAAEWPEVFDAMLRSHPDAVALRIVQVRLWASTGNVAGAAEAVEQLAEETAADHWNWVISAILNLHAGNHAAYRRSCDEILSRWSHHGFKPVQMITAQACLLSGQMEDRYDDVRATVDDALGSPCPDGWQLKFDVISGLMAYRSGELQQARGLLIKHTGGAKAHQIMAQFILAMVEQRDGNLELARETYAAAVATLVRESPESIVINYRKDIHYWLMVDILRREAAELLQIEDPGIQPEDTTTNELAENNE